MDKKEKIEYIKKRMRKKALRFATKVAPIYVLLNWRWGNEGVPSETDIFNNLIDKMKDLNEKTILISSGGLEVEIEEDKSLGGYLTGIMKMSISEHTYEDKDVEEMKC